MNREELNKYRLRHFWDLLLALISKDIRLKYKNTFLGFLWTIAYPLLFSLILFVAFKLIIRIRVENYIIFLLAALFPWEWFANSVNASPLVYIANASLIKKIKFSRYILPLSVVGHNMVHFLLAFPVLIVFLAFYGKYPGYIWLVGIPLLLVIQIMLTLGVSLIVASLNVFFRDLTYIVIIFTSFLFYFTPILYPETMVPKQYIPILYFNPLFPLIASWRGLLIDNGLNPVYLTAAFSYALVILAIGFWTYRRLEWRFAEVV